MANRPDASEDVLNCCGSPAAVGAGLALLSVTVAFFTGSPVTPSSTRPAREQRSSGLAAGWAAVPLPVWLLPVSAANPRNIKIQMEEKRIAYPHYRNMQ